MFNQKDVEVANKTSRNSPAIGGKAIVPKYVREHLELFCEPEDTLILDFGAGKTAAHARALLNDGWYCTAHEFGANVDNRYHNPLALSHDYHIVYASNVLNVQSSERMARETIKQIADTLKDGGCFFTNYPRDPCKSCLHPDEMADLLFEQFTIIKRIGGSAQAPLWMCTKQ